MGWIKKLGIIDLLIIILTIIILSFSIRFALGMQRSLGEFSDIVFTLEISGAEVQLMNQLISGKDIFNGNKNYHMGVIEKVQVKPNRAEHKDLEKGEISLIDIPNKSNVLLDIKVSSRLINDVVVLGGEELRVGLDILIKGNSFRCTGRVIAIEEKN